MIPKLLMAGGAGIFDFLHRRPQVTGLVRQDLAGDHQLTGGRFKVSGQLLKTRLLLPDIVLGAAVIFFAHAREMLPRLMGQRIQLDRTFSKLGAVEWNAPAQHATQVFAGLEHLLENGFALAQGRIRINPATGGQRQAGQQYNGQSFKSHDGSRSRGTAASILAPPVKTNSPIYNKGCPSALRRGQSLEEVFV